jgi:hypothetical protein
LICHDHIHGYIFGLRGDRFDDALRRTESDPERVAACLREELVVVAAPPAEPVSRAIEEDTRDDEEIHLLGRDPGSLPIRLRDPAVAWTERLLGIELVENEVVVAHARKHDAHPL